MQDELRADWLAAIESDEPLEAVDDQELAALAALSAELRRAGPDLAAISRAEAAFSSAFARGLAEQLRAAHPATVPLQRARPSRPVWARGRGLLRSLIALGVLLLAVAALLVATLVRGLQTSTQIGSAASPTAPPAASSAARPRAFQAVTVHPPLLSPAPHGTIAPPTPAASTAQSALGAAPRPSAHTNGGFAPMTPRIQAQANGPLTYRLPSSLPKLPARLPIYHLRQAPLRAADAARIAAHFPGLHPAAAAAGAWVARGTGARLEVVLATGEVRYTAGTQHGSASARGMAPQAAIATARAWLRAHGLYPANGDNATTSAAVLGPLIRVSFAPRTPLPLTDGGAIGLRVDFDAGGHVIAARRFWPTLVIASVAEVRGPAAVVASRICQAAGDHGAPQRTAAPTPEFRVARIVPGYALSADGAQLRPVYVLSGVITTRGGAARPTTQVLSATNP